MIDADDTLARAQGFAQEAERRAAARALAEALKRAHPEDAADMAVIVLDYYSAGVPEAAAWNVQLREHALWWADIATSAEVEAFVAAGLRRLENSAMGERMRKRLLVDLWQTMPEGWRAEFLARVDPAGAFRGAA